MDLLRFLAFSYLIVFLIGLSDGKKNKNKTGCKKVRPKFGRAKIKNAGETISWSCKKSKGVKYNLVGHRTARCVNKTWTQEPPLCVSKTCSPLKFNTQKLNHENIVQGYYKFLGCKASHERLYGSSIVYCVDGKRWNDTSPKCLSDDVVFDHDFENKDDLRMWMIKSFTRSGRKPNFVWKPHIGETSTPDTGPFHDHTMSPQYSGTYLYVESSVPSQESDSSIMISTRLYNTSVCFDFWYCMRGSQGGNLTLHVIENVNRKIRLTTHTETFSKRGNQGQGWLKGSIYIAPDVKAPYVITIKATRGAGIYGDIAIDDLKLRRCKGPELHSTVSTVKETQNALEESGESEIDPEDQLVPVISTPKWKTIPSLLTTTEKPSKNTATNIVTSDATNVVTSDTSLKSPTTQTNYSSFNQNITTLEYLENDINYPLIGSIVGGVFGAIVFIIIIIIIARRVRKSEPYMLELDVRSTDEYESQPITRDRPSDSFIFQDLRSPIPQQIQNPTYVNISVNV